LTWQALSGQRGAKQEDNKVATKKAINEFFIDELKLII
jgi:hypothetical protein